MNTVQKSLRPIHRFSDLIEVIPNALTKEFCDKCIEKFNKDENTYQGVTGAGVDLNVKRSIDLAITGCEGWEEEDDIFFKSLNKHLNDYTNKWQAWSLGVASENNSWRDSGYQMQRTDPGDFYIWHNDFSCGNNDNAPRYITFIWYLNDIHEDGYTEFIDGTKIQPEAGKLVMFPATWTYMHRGYPPKSETKYIVTGWVHSIIIP